jgi:hypothetical protein
MFVGDDIERRFRLGRGPRRPDDFRKERNPLAALLAVFKVGNFFCGELFAVIYQRPTPIRIQVLIGHVFLTSA